MKNRNQTKQVPCFRRWSRKPYGVFNSLKRCVKIGVLSVGMSIIALATTTVKAQAQANDTIVYKRIIDAVGVLGRRQSNTSSVMLQTNLYDRDAQGASPLHTLESAMRLSPSIDIRERGGKAIQTDILIRGGSFDQTMVMLNGINFTDVRTGHQSHSLPIDIDCVSDIELVDGVQGVGAYAGAVNFVTRPLRSNYVRLDAMGGQHGYSYTNLSGATRRGKFSAFGAISQRHSNGYIENTDFVNYNAYTRLSYNDVKLGYWDMQLGYQRRGFGANGFYSLQYPNQFEETSTALGSLRWLKNLNKDWEVNVALSYRKNYDRFELIRDDESVVPFNYHNTDNVGVQLRSGYDWVGGKTVIGGDYTFNHIYSTVLGDELDAEVAIPGVELRRYTHAKSRSVGNFWVRHIKSINKFNVALSGGVSVHPYGVTPTWSGAVGYTPIDGLIIEAGAAQSMRLPTFTDLYYTAPGHKGNPNLVPEHAVTYRFETKYNNRNWKASFLVYDRVGKDIIDWVRESPEDDWQSQQITSLNTFGVELMGSWSRNKGFFRRVKIAYGYINTNKQSDGQTSRYALDYLKHKVASSVDMCLFRNLTISLIGSLYDRNGSYFQADGKEQEYKPYFLLDARVSWQQNAFKFYVDITNITSTEYVDFGGLAMPKAWFNLGVTITL